MFRTAKIFTLQSLPAWKLVILALLVIWLDIHFLVKDLLFLSNLTSIAPISKNIDKLTHQDNLVIKVDLPGWISSSQPLSASPAILSSQAQVFLPMLQPPII
jgi:hypothetical protein